MIISCITPSNMYLEETLLTLNYASRAMNIKNQPIISLGNNDHKRYSLIQENENLKKENYDLREQWIRAV